MKLSLRTHITIPAWVAGVAAAISVGCGVLALQLSRVLFTVIRESDYEAARMVTGVATAVQSDSTEILIPDEMYLEDEAKELYSYGALQTILFRRTPEAATDWQWSFNGAAWYSTDDTQADHATLLDPPNLIFICRLHLQSVARRKSASLKAKLLGQPNSHLGGRHIPPPLDTGATPRDVFEAPDTLCCPISSCVMTQPVVAPSGKSFDYAALCEWVVRHGTDPTTSQALSLHDLYPNLVIREQVERWLAGEDLGFTAAAAAAGAAASGAAGDAMSAPDQGLLADGVSLEASMAGPSGAAEAAGTLVQAGVSSTAAAAAAAGAKAAETAADAGAVAALSPTHTLEAASSGCVQQEQQQQQEQERQAGVCSSTGCSSSSSEGQVLEGVGGAGLFHQPSAANCTPGASSSSSSSVGVQPLPPKCGAPQQQQVLPRYGDGSISSTSANVGGASSGVTPVVLPVEAPAGSCVVEAAAAAASSSGQVARCGSSREEQEVEAPSPAGLAAVLQPMRHHLPRVVSSSSCPGAPSSSGPGAPGSAVGPLSSSSSAGQLCSSSSSSSSREWPRVGVVDSSSGCGGASLAVGQAPRVPSGVAAGAAAAYVPRHLQPSLAGGLPVGLPTPAMLQATRLVQL